MSQPQLGLESCEKELGSVLYGVDNPSNLPTLAMVIEVLHARG
jgi:hypothetical protein